MVSQNPANRKPIIQTMKEGKFIIEYFENSQINPHTAVLL